ncbi:hypothetical protein ACVILI_000754 [Mesorhizobium sp. USDA 4775]|uniref:hypothetical protein n=1 Tax=Mesorhizobium jarvisii TaxID=1777867 RepID=UPI00049A3132|nr:hypothetical protein [Mesorhizobium jarvisii]AID33376.1 hypothetical protein MCHK_5583 [Mesorhizobium huakuii 7653R]MCH4555411.1 hypothetical protein [Mesorhizobium jarvisii]
MEHEPGPAPRQPNNLGRSYFLPPLLYRARHEGHATRSALTPAANRVKARFERDRFSMRGLSMALLAFDAPSLNANHWAGRLGSSPRSSKTTAKTTTKTV